MFKKLASEFREFAVRGNVVDMAVGIIIGAAFGGIVTSLVDDVIMPPLGLITGNMDFTQMFVNLGPVSYETLAEATAAGAPVLRYGSFINSMLNFVLVAFAIFLLVRAVNRMRRKEAAKPEQAPAPTAQEKLLMEIRDLMKARA